MNSKPMIVSHGEKDGTLSEFLRSRLGISGKKAKELLDHRIVFVNGHRVWMARHALQKGDTVEVLVPQPRIVERTSTAIPLLYEDTELLVAGKPADMLSDGPDSVESRLRVQCHQPEIRAVHRLDRETTGCLLFSRNPAVRDELVRLFEERGILKVYHAIALGAVSRQTHAIQSPIDGLPAVTRVQVVDANEQASHVKLNLETGRTHQIRKHLAHIRHPVLGDKMYGAALLDVEAARAAPRQMLHAAVLEFNHPLTHVPIRAEAALPADFRACLRLLQLRQ